MFRRPSLQRSVTAALVVAATVFVRQATAQVLTDMRDLSPRELRSEAFVLDAPQTVTIDALGAEPARDRRFGRGVYWDTNDDDKDTWPAAAWIIDARTRQVVWDLRTVESERSRDGLRSFEGSARLPAGTYVAYYGSFPATSITTDGDFNAANVRAFVRGLRRSREVRYSGPYVDDGAYRRFHLVIRGAGRVLAGRDKLAALRPADAGVLAELVPDSAGVTARYGFQLDRATEVDVRGLGELMRDGAYDHGWIQNADTRQRVWTMNFARTAHAGGSFKNRMTRQTLRLEPGRYVAYYVQDDSHGPDDWNAVPPHDPEGWGLTLRIADGAARARVQPFSYEPVPAGQTIVSLTGLGDDELRSEGFTLRAAMDVRIFAMGEGSNPEGEMDDYAWIVNTTTRRRVWTMDYDGTEHAGGADKNRLFDGTVRLEPGSYMVYYKSDGSHSVRSWNGAPPAEARYWGVSVFPASGRLDRSAVGPYERSRTAAIAELVRMRDDVRASRSFTISQSQNVRVYAIGEGDDGQMYDFAWIEEAGTGRVVWEMTYRTSTHAGGARKNRLFDAEVRLAAGNYVLRFETDGSHAYGGWNSDPPDDPEAWGVSLLPVRP